MLPPPLLNQFGPGEEDRGEEKEMREKRGRKRKAKTPEACKTTVAEKPRE